jgi:hypothetical protein
MLHCNMKFAWQTSYALQFLQPCGVGELQCRSRRGEGLQRANEFA